MSQYLVSVIRTWVPIIIGSLISKLLVLGVVLDDVTSEGLKTGITALVIALYYAAARWLEQKFPKFGLLLGYIRQPVYIDPTKTVHQQRQSLGVDIAKAAKTPSPDAV